MHFCEAAEHARFFVFLLLFLSLGDPLGHTHLLCRSAWPAHNSECVIKKRNPTGVIIYGYVSDLGHFLRFRPLHETFVRRPIRGQPLKTVTTTDGSKARFFGMWAPPAPFILECGPPAVTCNVSQSKSSVFSRGAIRFHALCHPG